jgi:hypothetical protein
MSSDLSDIPANADARTVTDLEQDALNRDFEQLSNCSSTLVLAACHCVAHTTARDVLF